MITAHDLGWPVQVDERSPSIAPGKTDRALTIAFAVIVPVIVVITCVCCCVCRSLQVQPESTEERAAAKSGDVELGNCENGHHGGVDCGSGHDGGGGDGGAGGD